MSDGTRRITHISELTGAFSDVISMQGILLFEKQGIGPNGKVRDGLYSTLIVPKCVVKIYYRRYSHPGRYD